MGLDTKTYWLTDRQSQFDFDFDLTEAVLGRSPTRAVIGKRVLRSEFAEQVLEESTTGAFKERGHQQDDISCCICVWIEL
jgi:hypothetical protein